MKKNLFVFFLLFLTLNFSIFAQDEIYFRNPGDARVFHSNGLPFKSETKANSSGVVPKTDLMVGDAVQTNKRAANVFIGNFEVELKKNTLMSIQSVTDDKVIVYLMDGSVNATSGNETSLTQKEFIVITPVSRFSATIPFDIDVSSISTEESVNIKRGNVFAHNFLTKENVSLKETESIDFLKDRNKIIAVDSSAISEQKAYDDLGIKTPSSQPSDSSTPRDPSNKRILSIRLTVGKDGAYISPYDGRIINVPRTESNRPERTTRQLERERVAEVARDYGDDNDNASEPEPVKYAEPEQDEEDKTPYIPRPYVEQSVREQRVKTSPKDPISEYIEEADVDEPEPEDEEPVVEDEPVKEEEKQEEKKPVVIPPPVRPSKPHIVYTANNKNAVFDEPIEDSKPEVVEDEPEDEEPVVEDKPEDEDLVIEDVPVKEEKPEPKKEQPKKKKSKATRPFGLGVRLGISSAFDWQMMKAGNSPNLRLHADPYMRSENTDVRLSFLIDYEQVDNNFRFAFPQIDNLLNNPKKLPLIQHIITDYATQFVNDFVLGNWFFISRYHDLPIEYSSMNLNKFSALDNEYVTYHYEQDGGTLKKVNDDTISRKIPLYFNIDTKYFIFKVFADDLDNLRRFNPNNTADNLWKRDDASMLNATIGFDTKYFGMTVGGIYATGAYNEADSKATDRVIATVTANGNINSDIDFTINGYIPLFNLVTDYTNPNSEKISLADFFTAIAEPRFAAGVSFNVRKPKFKFNLGADFNMGQIYTGIMSKKSVFTSFEADGSSYYVDGTKGAFAVYPYLNFDFDLGGALSLNVNADMPIFIGGSLNEHMTSWSSFDFFYRMNAGATLKINLSKVMELSAKLTLDDIFANRISDTSGFSNYLANEFTFWNFIPRLAFTIDDGPIYFRLTAEQHTTEEKTFNPSFTFQSSVAIGTDYMLNPNYIRSMGKKEAKRERDFTLVFNADIMFNSAKYAPNGTEDGNYSAVTITPHVGVRHKVFTIIAKFEIENFKLPNIFNAPLDIGQIAASLIDEINIFNIAKIKNTETVDASRRSLFTSDQYIETLRSNVGIPYILDVNIADTASFVNGLLGGNKNAFAELSLGWMGKQSVYLNTLAHVDWSAGFAFDSQTSFNMALNFSGFYFGLNFATTLGFSNAGFTHGFTGDTADYIYLGGLGLGFENDAFALKFNFGVQNNMYYNSIDYLAHYENGLPIHTFEARNGGSTGHGMQEYVDAELKIKLSKTLNLNVNYDLPMAWFMNDLTGFYQDRLFAKLTFSTPLLDVYGVLGKRGLFFEPTGWFDDYESFALKGGLEFKADYTTFNVEFENAHFIYLDTPDLNVDSIKSFSINVGVRFGLI